MARAHLHLFSPITLSLPLETLRPVLPSELSRPFEASLTGSGLSRPFSMALLGIGNMLLRRLPMDVVGLCGLGRVDGLEPCSEASSTKGPSDRILSRLDAGEERCGVEARVTAFGLEVVDGEESEVWRMPRWLCVPEECRGRGAEFDKAGEEERPRGLGRVGLLLREGALRGVVRNVMGDMRCGVEAAKGEGFELRLNSRYSTFGLEFHLGLWSLVASWGRADRAPGVGVDEVLE